MSTSVGQSTDVVVFYRLHKEYIDKWALNQDGNTSIQLVVYAQVIQEEVARELQPLLDYISIPRTETVSVGGGGQ